MPRVCTVCTHSDSEAIDRALVDGEAYRYIASRRGVSTAALQRHKTDHIPAALAKAQEAESVAHGDDLLGQVRHLQGRAQSILDQAEKAGDFRSALAAIGQARSCLELLAKLLGELDERPQVNILVAPEWLQVRAAVLEALAAHPDARSAVAARLLALEGSRQNGHRG